MLGEPAGGGDVRLTPFFRTHRRNYSVYFDVVTPAGFDAKVAALAAERDRARRLDAATIGSVLPGDPATDREHNYKSEPTDRAAAAPAGSRTTCRCERAGARPSW